MENSKSKEKKGEYHNFLKEVLKEFHSEHLEKLIRHKGCIKIYCSKYHSRDMIEYNPDFVFKIKTGKRSFEYIVFEFIDTESDTDIIADISECFFIENCRMLLFLSKTSEIHKNTKRIIEVCKDGFRRIRENKDKKDILDIISLDIHLKEEKTKIKEIISKELNKSIKI